MLSVQGEALTAAKILIKDLLPYHRALTYKDQENFKLRKEQATAGRYEKCIDGHNTIKERQTTTTTERTFTYRYRKASAYLYTGNHRISSNPRPSKTSWRQFRRPTPLSGV